MGNSNQPETIVNALKATPGVSHIELRSTFQFLNPADLAALKSYLGIAGVGGGPIMAADIADATTAGLTLLTAADAAAQRTALGLARQCVLKTTDTTRSSTTTLATDPQMVLNVPSAGNWLVRGNLIGICASSTPGIWVHLDCGGSFPSNAAGRHFIDNDVVAFSYQGQNFSSYSAIPVRDGDYGIFGWNVASTAEKNIIPFEYVFTVAAACSLNLQWAQWVASSDSTTLAAGSWMELMPF